jgi:hypothetical protein
MLEYTLEVATPLQPHQLLLLLFGDVVVEDTGDGLFLSQPGFHLWARSTPLPHALALQLGVASSLQMVFRPEGMVNYARAMGNILQTIAKVLSDTQYRLVFHCAEVEVLLWRKDEALFLNQSSSFWNSGFLAHMPLDYELEGVKPLAVEVPQV